MTSERTADADVATVREECAKLISARVDPLLESGSLPPMWPWWLPLVDAMSDRLVAGGTPRSNDPDLGGASPEGNDGVRGAAALDRLVARNQQLQEALAAAERVVEMFNEQAPEWMQDEDWPLLAGLRAALESVHARTSQ